MCLGIICNEDIICNRWRWWWTSSRDELRNSNSDLPCEWKPIYVVCVIMCMMILDCYDSLSMNYEYLLMIWFVKHLTWILMLYVIHEYWCYMCYMNIDAICDSWILMLYMLHEYWYYMRYMDIATIWDIWLWVPCETHWQWYGHMSIVMIWDIGLHG